MRPETLDSPEQLWFARMAVQLTNPADLLVADVGCGEAEMAVALARTLPARTKVLAVDSDQETLARVATALDAAGLAGRVTTVCHDLHAGLSEVDSPVRAALDGADLIWASASLHHLGDQQRVVTELASLLRAGGRLALVEGGLPERNLPWDIGIGAPGLQVRLDAAQDAWFARMRAELPGSVPMPYGVARRSASRRVARGRQQQRALRATHPADGSDPGRRPGRTVPPSRAAGPPWIPRRRRSGGLDLAARSGRPVLAGPSR